MTTEQNFTEKEPLTTLDSVASNHGQLQDASINLHPSPQQDINSNFQEDSSVCNEETSDLSSVEFQGEFADVKARLDQIAEMVSHDDIPLDEALDLYEEAVKLGTKVTDLLERETS